MTEQEAFNEGYDAFEMYLRIDQAPSEYSDALRQAWIAGWIAAHEALMVTEAEAVQAWHDEQDLKTLFNER